MMPWSMPCSPLPSQHAVIAASSQLLSYISVSLSQPSDQHPWPQVNATMEVPDDRNRSTWSDIDHESETLKIRGPQYPSPPTFPSSSSSSSSRSSSYLLTTTTPFPDFIDFKGVSMPYLSGWENDTDCVYGGWNCSTPNTTANYSLGASDEVGLSDPKLWALLLLIFPMFTVFGNSLVVMSVYKEKTLRTVTNYFIVSLAVADIMVAVLVMPFAVYTEVNNGDWNLGDELCDTWVAMDVMCCTASILNLTAISVDRFIAVTQPIKYAKHKNSKRVYITLALTWVVSIAISSPIALGMNYTERRRETPKECVFYNSDFLIYSSMASFYIPCVIMILLYWRIFRAIRLRAKRAAAHRRARLIDSKAMTNVIENHVHNDALGTPANAGKTTSTDNSATEDGCQQELLPSSRNCSQHPHHFRSAPGTLARSPIAEETSFTNYNAKFSTVSEDTADEEHVRRGVQLLKSGTSDDNAHIIHNDKSNDCMLSATSDEGHVHEPVDKSTGYAAPATVEVVSTPHLPPPPRELLSPPPKRPVMHLGFKNHAAKPTKSQQNNNKPKASPQKKSITKFNFRLRHSKRKKDQRSMANRRERKATQTLAIVLGVFLLCWVPFFTINIINAICIRYNLFDSRPECQLDAILFSFFVWLGYINSFLNPVIYTIFNIEFRRAFKKLLECPR